MEEARPGALKRLYFALFCIVGTVFALVGGATIRWWLAPETATIAFFCFGIFPIAFYTVLGTTIMDPGKNSQGGIIDKRSPRYVDRFGSAMWPVVLFTAFFGVLLSTWFIPVVRSATATKISQWGFQDSVSLGLFDDSADVALVACRQMLDNNGVRPQNSMQYHAAREKEFGPEILDCLTIMTGDPIGMSIVSGNWHAELAGEVDDDRACRLTNRLRYVADTGDDLSKLWLLEFAAVGKTAAIQTCSAQALRALAQKTNGDIVGILPTPERAANWEIRWNSDVFFRASFDDTSTAPLNELANWSSPAQRAWSLSFACESLKTTPAGRVDVKLNAFVAEKCGIDDPLVFAKVCEREEPELIVADICGRVHEANRELAFIEANGVVRRGLARGQVDKLVGAILKAALDSNGTTLQRGVRTTRALIANSDVDYGEFSKITGAKVTKKEVDYMLKLMGQNGRLDVNSNKALRILTGDDKRKEKADEPSVVKP